MHQQPRLLNDTDITSDDEEHIYTRIPKQDSSFTSNKTLDEETEPYSNIKAPMSTSAYESASAINVQTHSRPTTHCSQIIPYYDTSFFKYEKYFQGFFLPDDYSLDLKTLQQQLSQDPVLRTVYSLLTRNEKPEFFPTLIAGTPFLHAYYKRVTRLFIGDSTNLISLYTTHTKPLQRITPLLQILCVILLAFVFHSEYFELSLINFMNISHSYQNNLQYTFSILLFSIS